MKSIPLPSVGLPTYPKQYLLIEECQSGEREIMPLTGRASLDITRQVKRWVSLRFGGELRLSGQLMSKIPGQYYAALITDGRPPETCVVWSSSGFYLEGNA